MLIYAMQQSDLVIHAFFLNILFHYGLSQETEYSSLRQTIGPCLSVLYPSFPPHPSLSPLATRSLFSTPRILFLFHRQAHLCCALDYTQISHSIGLSLSNLLHVVICIPAAVNGTLSFFFLIEQYSILCVYHFFIHSSVSGHLGYFHVLAMVDKAALNIGMSVSFELMFFFPRIYMQKQIIWQLYFQFFEEYPYCSPQWLHQLTYPPTVLVKGLALMLVAANRSGWWLLKAEVAVAIS